MPIPREILDVERPVNTVVIAYGRDKHLLWTSRNFTTKSSLYPFIGIPNQVNDFIQWTPAFHVCIIQRLFCPLDFPFRMSFIQQCGKFLSKKQLLKFLHSKSLFSFYAGLPVPLSGGHSVHGSGWLPSLFLLFSVQVFPCSCFLPSLYSLQDSADIFCTVFHMIPIHAKST